MGAAVAIDVLGTLRIGALDGRRLEVGGPMRRRLLGLLVARRGLETRSEWLIDALWDGRPPAGAAATLQSHVAHVRRVLEPGRPAGAEPSVLVSAQRGYLLVAQAVDVDADRVVELVHRAEGQHPEHALVTLERALGMFRGDPYEDLADVEAVAAERARLSELHMVAVDGRLDALRALGRFEQLRTAAADAMSRDPLSERPVVAYAESLAAAGRSAEALRALHGYRRHLAEQTGIDPSPRLGDTERGILAGTFSGATRLAGPVPVAPQVRYATAADGVSIAYQSIGDGPVFVAVPPLAQNIEICWHDHQHRRLIERAAERCRFVHFDKRGTGMSDRTADFTLERRIGDFLAVLDAAGVERGVVCGVSEAGPLAIAFTAAHPDRVTGLYLVNTLARALTADDYPIGVTPAEYQAVTHEWESAWGGDDGRILDWFAPSRRHDLTYAAWFGHYMRQSCSPGTLAAINRANASIDVRHLLGSITVPTVVAHRAGDRVTPIAWGRHLAQHIPGAEFRQIDGDDHLPWVGDTWTDIIDHGIEFAHRTAP